MTADDGPPRKITEDVRAIRQRLEERKHAEALARARTYLVKLMVGIDVELVPSDSEICHDCQESAEHGTYHYGHVDVCLNHLAGRVRARMRSEGEQVSRRLSFLAESAESNVGGVLMERAAEYVNTHGHNIPREDLVEHMAAEFKSLTDEQLAELANVHAEAIAA